MKRFPVRPLTGACLSCSLDRDERIDERAGPEPAATGSQVIAPAQTFRPASRCRSCSKASRQPWSASRQHEGQGRVVESECRRAWRPRPACWQRNNGPRHRPSRWGPNEWSRVTSRSSRPGRSRCRRPPRLCFMLAIISRRDELRRRGARNQHGADDQVGILHEFER